uniref:G-protein coupled receptors family 1 profile domain-containing protein n=1 Tax=Mustela putorius furo TaxID=9669 RepID=M3XR99_MUSPF
SLHLNLNLCPYQILLSFRSNQEIQNYLYILYLCVFVCVCVSNTVMILLIHRNSRLHTPMYFLLSHLSFMDILHISNIIPKMSGNRTISFAGCGFQIFLYLTLLGGQCLLLEAMTYDCYVVIYYLLHYPIFMSDYVCILMAGGVNSIVLTAYATHFPSCDSRVIDHLFCEVPAMLKSCVDTMRSLFYPCLLNLCFLCLNSPYYPSNEITRSTEKFSTCSFHMILVTMYYGSFIFTYMRPKSYHICCSRHDKSTRNDKYLAIFYIILTCTLNLIIYSFRNKYVLEIIRKILVFSKYSILN